MAVDYFTRLIRSAFLTLMSMSVIRWFYAAVMLDALRVDRRNRPNRLPLYA